MAKVLLGDVVDHIKDKIDKDTTDLEYYVGGEHIDGDEIMVRRKGLIQGSTIGPAFHMRFRQGDVLLMSRNPHLRKASMVDFDGICSDVSYVCRTKDNGVLLQSLLPFILQTPEFWQFAEENKKGGLPFFLNWKDFARFEFELIPIDRQQQMSDLLWAMERVKTAYRELIARTDDLVKSQFIEMFGNPVSNDKNWPLVQLRDCLYGIDSGKSLNCEGHPRSGELPAVLKLSAVTYGEYDPEENKELPSADAFIPELEVRAGDLLFSRKNTREYVGMTAIVRETPRNLMLPDLIFRLLPRDCIRAEYLHQLINHTQYRPVISDLASGTAGSMPNISKQRLLALAIPLPPVDRQMAIEPIVQQSDKSKYLLRHIAEAFTIRENHRRL